jgi:hypothetical protein
VVRSRLTGSGMRSVSDQERCRRLDAIAPGAVSRGFALRIYGRRGGSARNTCRPRGAHMVPIGRRRGPCPTRGRQIEVPHPFRRICGPDVV